VVLDLRLVGQESAAGWRDAIDALVARGLRAPVLAVVDGNLGLHTPLRTQWPGVAIQRCTVHYADQGIMPSATRGALWDKDVVLMRSA